MRRYIPILISLIIFAGPIPKLIAQQFVAHHGGRQVVVHTSPVPVVLHRLIPPNYGRHVTLREYQSGRIPTVSNSGFVAHRGGSRTPSARRSP